MANEKAVKGFPKDPVNNKIQNSNITLLKPLIKYNNMNI